MTINYKDQFTFNQYDIMALSNKEWQSDVNKHNAKYMELKDIEVIDTTIIDELINNNYNFWVTVVNEDPYFNTDCYLVDLYLSYINKPITIYINKEYLNKLTGIEPEVIEETTEQTNVIELSNDESYVVKHTTFTNKYEAVKYCNDNDFDPELMLITEKETTNIETIYWYEYTLRGFSIGCQPKGFIEHDPNKGRYGLIAYNRLLTDTELSDYDLKLHHATFEAA